ncbi:predicted phosphatase [Lentisphaera araneosa HTCC2155]|uniref:Predicted phosphatase n=1 Tax=Lentisphaera araneosa HTCC2155 TaxID=313628 RepID=A6DKS5_9BACT|nr:PhoX family phosphatase [Lentisphaera araneosa]EDM27973.1 predicted phosphatase [Lentisphaera araneosa HTCC2155]
MSQERVNKSQVLSMQEMSRRHFMKLGMAGMGAMSLGVSGKEETQKGFTAFEELPARQASGLRLAQGFVYKNLCAFGDPLKAGLESYDPKKLSAEEQKNRFGGACDFLHVFEQSADEAIICINNEFPEHGQHPDSKERKKAAYHSVGVSVAAIKRDKDKNWEVNLSSPYSRRITPETKAVITGPAAGHERMKSKASPDGIVSAGTLGNCAGGYTPWGTYLTAEENVQGYFSGEIKGHKEEPNFKRFGMNKKGNFFAGIDPRFDLDSEYQSALHFGLVVEIDPLKPNEPMKKHSMLGRCKHECAKVRVRKDGYVEVYTSDDQGFEYIYKFVSAKKYKEGDRDYNKSLLESGVLHVAKFAEDGTMKWLPMVHGQGPLTEKNGFRSQADVQIDSRKAADLLEATPMDRPEDIDINPKTGNIFFFMTGNRGRSASKLNAANKVEQGAGHIIELNDQGDGGEWSFFVICGKFSGDPAYSSFSKETTLQGCFVYPDNGAFDLNGELWVCSDGYSFPGFTDGMWHCQKTEGGALSKRFATPPKAAEFTGPYFMKNGKELFLSVQHPATNPSGSFPDFNHLPARSAVVVISRS